VSGALDTSVTLEEVFAIVGAKRVPLAPELAGYLALEISEQADAAGGDIDPKFVFIGEEGTIGLVRPKRGDVASGNAEASIRTLLSRLLEASGSQTPALGSASRRKASGGLPSLVEELEAALIPVNRAAGRRALARLAREVKRVTLGVGRNASNPAANEMPPRRGSAPSYSAVSAPPESPRDRPPSVRPPTPPTAFPAEEDHISLRAPPPEILDERPPSTTPAPYHDAGDLPTVEFEPQARAQQDSVDSLIANFGVSSKSDQQLGRELKAMVGLDPTPPPPGAGAAGAGDGDGADDVEALLAFSDGAAPVRPTRASTASVPADGSDRGAAALLPRQRTNPETSVRIQLRSKDERQLPTGPSQLRSHPSLADIRTSKGNGWLYLLLAALLGAATFVAWHFLKEGALSGRTADKVKAEAAQAEQDRQNQLLARQAAACKATLTVTDVPMHAEVLLRMGQAPVDVPRMPVGARLELVATADGYAPKRAVVLPGASWDKGPDDKPRIDAPVQLEKSKAKPGQVDPWPPAEPGSAAGGDGPPGTVHVISNVKGAEVWLLAGLGPDATISALACDAPVDVLVAGPTTFRKRLRVVPADFVPGDTKGVRTARVSAQP
jgi:hypothetical protein